MTIGKLARAAGVGVETVRYYHRAGLLALPAKGDGMGVRGSVRHYCVDDLSRLRFIRSAQAAGFSLREIRELLDLDERQDRTRIRAIAMQRVQLLDEKIDELNTVRLALSRLAARCAAQESGRCPIIAAFQEQPRQRS